MHSLLEACEHVFNDQGESQSSYWLASQIMEMRLWRASEADVQAALTKDIDGHGSSSRFMRVGEDEFALRAWAADQGLKEFSNTPSPAQLEADFPSVAKWVRSYGHIEIGDQHGFGFIVRAIDYGGLIFEDDKPRTLAAAMTALEDGLAEWFEAEETA